MTVSAVGQTVGNYRLEELLGTGGMGQVYRGTHIHLGRTVAVKLMHANLASDPGFQARFLQEAQSAAALTHPNIVAIQDFGQQEGRFYLVMELLADGSVRSLLQDACQWRPTLAAAVRARSGASVRHRAGVRAQSRHGPPRHQARQPAGPAARCRWHTGPCLHREGRRLRPGAHRGRWRDDGERRHARHPGLHVAGTVPGGGTRWAERYLLARHRPLRDRHRLPAVRDEEPQRRCLQARLHRAAFAAPGTARSASGAGSDHPALPGKAARRPLRHRDRSRRCARQGRCRRRTAAAGVVPAPAASRCGGPLGTTATARGDTVSVATERHDHAAAGRDGAAATAG